eukprot:scaffold203_cov386-Prasinococcus_capsulatus_cf.AAC.1
MPRVVEAIRPTKPNFLAPPTTLSSIKTQWNLKDLLFTASKQSDSVKFGTEQQPEASNQPCEVGLDNRWTVEHPTLRTKEGGGRLRTPN